MTRWDPSARQYVSAEGGFAYAVVDGDIHVYVDGLPVYVLENWRPVREPDPQWLRELPSRMLSARHEIVPFTGRVEELADLLAWRDSARRLAVRWLQGPGGQGKSRLAAAFAQKALADGWKVVRAVHGPGNVLAPPIAEESVDLRTDGAPGLLLVVDYADHWPLPHLTWLLSNRLLHRPAVPTRVLMLARSSDMWPAVQATLNDVQAATSTQLLGPLPGGDDDGLRAEMFRSARDAFAAVHETEFGPAFAARLLPPMPLENDDFGLTLSVHMAALVAVDALVRGEVPPTEAAFLVTYLLNRERSHWARLHTQDAGRRAAATGRIWSTAPEVMNRTVFAATLTGPLPRQTALDIVGHATANPPADAHPAEQTVADHTTCYPPADPHRGTVFEPLLPDRLAEDFLALTLPGHTAETAYPSAPWAPEILGALLPHGANERSAPWTPRALTFLAASAARWPHLRHGHLYPLLRQSPGLAVAAGGPALSTLLALDDIDPDLLEGIKAHLPAQESAEFDPPRSVLVERLFPHWMATTNDKDRRAAAFESLAFALTGAGRLLEALAATEKAVALYEPLAARHPMVFAPDLARAVHSLCGVLNHLDRLTEAEEAGRRAVELRRRPSEIHPPDVQRFCLSEALVGHAAVLRQCGRDVEALRAQTEALELAAELVVEYPGAYEDTLGLQFLNVGVTLMAALREPAALAATHAAVLLLDRKARKGHPVREGPLSTALTNLGRFLLGMSPEMLTGVNWRRWALQASHRAVTINRRRARANPFPLTDDLVQSLRVHAAALEAAGHHSAAHTVRDEVDELDWGSSVPRESGHLPYVAYDRRETEEAVDAVELAVFRYIVRHDVRGYADHLLPRLHTALRRQDAPELSLLYEIADLHRRMAPYGGAHQYLLSNTYVNIGLAHWRADRRVEAIEALERAVEADRQLAASDPARYRDHLIDRLYMLTEHQRLAGLRHQARASRREARRLRWGLHGRKAVLPPR
ncbi:tetratricopeptide repeat protein [Streptomyces sp. gb14]|uniref:tetratricopeptide repeat protein n=1 Tax=Streptomyces sp. gb14 TaxID=1827753 RepID=UPI000BF06739|nr:tetratricopeptide repeat protein [Streptomyces sp. gb14]